jgi:hypothetical protein
MGNLLLHTGPYLHFDSNHPITWGVTHSLVSRCKVICQDRKDFNMEIKDERHYLIRNE